MEPHHQLHVLTDGVGGISSGPEHHVPPEDPEGPGDDQGAVDRLPSHPAGQERPEVLEHLEPGKQLGRQPNTDHVPVLNDAPVGDPDDAARRDRVSILEKRPHDPGEGIAFEQAVSIDRAEERRPGVVEAGVQGVGLASIGLVDDPEVLIDRAPVHLGNRRGRQGAAGQPIRRDQLEGRAEAPEGAVAGAIVHHDDLELGVRQHQERADRVNAGGFFVVGRGDQRDRGHPRARQQVAEIEGPEPPGITAEGVKGGEGRDQIAGVEGQEIPEDELVQPIDDGPNGRAHDASPS